MKMLTKEQRRKIALANLQKANLANPYMNPALRASYIASQIIEKANKNNGEKEMEEVGSRRTLALRGLRRYLRAYLDGVKSIRDFDKWRIKAPGANSGWLIALAMSDARVDERVGHAAQVNLLIQV